MSARETHEIHEIRGAEPARGAPGAADDRLVELLDGISAQLDAIDPLAGQGLSGERPEAMENRGIRDVQAALARGEARTTRGAVREVSRRARRLADEARRAQQHAIRPLVPRPAAADVSVADLERLCRQARGVAPTVVWAHVVIPTADGDEVTATTGDLPPTLGRALAAGPQNEVARHGRPVAVHDTRHDDRWPALRLAASTAHAVLVQPVGDHGVLTLVATAPGTFDDAARAVAAELAARAGALLAGDPTDGALRARHLVLTASTLLARRQGVDTDAAFNALLDRADAAGTTILACAEQVVDELGPAPTNGSPPEPATLRRALAYLEEHAGEDVEVADVAAAAGVGVRGLQMVFRRWRDTTPLGALREIRLTRAHEDLEAADPRDGRTVVDIISRWRFTHPGRFSVAYRRRYGCSPSETLRS